MTSWLLSWNPKNYGWLNFYKDRAITASGQPVKDSWRCSNGAAAIGDAVYLTRTGDEPRGIIARGVITRAPYEAPHYDPARLATGETIQVVGIDFEDIRDPDQDEFLPIQTLENEVDPKQTWNPQSSGIAINEEAAKELQRRWSQLKKPELNQRTVILSDDCRVFAKYEHAAQGAWTTMPEADKKVYIKIHLELAQIVADVLTALKSGSGLDKRLTLGFNTSGGVRGNRPKDLWGAIFPRDAEAYMPQVYLIVSHRGVELGYAAAIHREDFSNPAVKRKLAALSPRIFDALPAADSDETKALSATLAQQGVWFFRRKTRLAPKENDFDSLASLLSFLKSPEGKAWGAGTVSRYWLPHELTTGIDFSHEFLKAAELFQPLMVRAQPVRQENVRGTNAVESTAIEFKTADGIREGFERLMEIYPERRSRPFATDQELWSALADLEHRFKTLPSFIRRSTLSVTWSVGQGNWARVPWIAFLDKRITDTTQSGVYGALLFREDMSGVYLTFTQGVTEPKKEHGTTSGLQLLRENATALRGKFGELGDSGFKLDAEIDLRTDGTLGRDYEAATIAYKLYERGNIPRNEEIARDIDALLTAYDRYITERDVEPLDEPADGGRSIPPAPPYTMEEALTDVFLDRSELDELLTLFRTRKNLVLQGPPGVGKTFIAKRLGYLLMGHRDNARTRMVQFHQAYSYEDFIQGYRPTDTGGFARRDGVFFNFAKLAEADLDQPYVFIIDEINRGNLSKILGELMMLIEFDKRGSEYALPLTYSRPDEPPFSVPSNLFVVGLMNTADRSLAMVDYALRRRFAFYKLEPKISSEKFRAYLQVRGAERTLINMIIDRVSALNDEIASDKLRLGPGYQIGHSFFVPADPTIILDTAWYGRVIKSEIGPLLEEYWFDNAEKAEAWTTKLLDDVG